MTTQSETRKEPQLGELGIFSDSISSVDSSLQHYNTFNISEDIDSDKFRNMFKIDGQVSGLWRMLTTPIRSSNIKINKAKGSSNREINFINDIFFSNNYNNGMNLSFAIVLSTVMRMLIDGWSPHEIVWKIVDGEVRVRKIAYRSPKDTKIKVNKYGEIEKYIQHPNSFNSFSYNEVEIPRDKMLHFVYGPEWNLIYGRSIFLQSFYHYEKKHKLYYLGHIANQIRALRLRVLKSPADRSDEEIKEVLNHVAKLGFNSSFNLPDKYELEFPDLGTDRLDLLPYIQHHDIQMSKSILSQVIDVGTESGMGSYNLSDTHLDIFMMNLGLIAKYISDIFNKDLIPKLIDWNFGTGRYPTLEFLPFDKQDKKFLANLFTRIVGSKTLNISPELRIEIEKQISDLMKSDIDFDKITKRDLDDAEKVKDLEVEKLRQEIEKLKSDAAQVNQPNAQNSNNPPM